MRRQPLTKNLSYSGISQQAPLPPSQNFASSYYFPRPPNITTYSRDSSQHKSKQRLPSNSFQFINHPTDTTQTNSSEAIHASTKQLLDLKQNSAPSNIDKEVYVARLQSLEQKFTANDARIQALQKNSNRWEQLRRLVEELMKKQVGEVKAIEEFEERVGTVEQIITHLKTTKADRKQLQSADKGSNSALVERINQLCQHNVRLDEQMLQVNTKFEKMISKIEASFVTMGQKYEQFIETNIIRSIEHVNRLTNQYHDQMESLKKEQETQVSKINSLQKDVSSVHKEISSLQKQTNSLQKETGSLQKQTSSLLKQTSSLGKQTSSLQKEVSALQKQNLPVKTEFGNLLLNNLNSGIRIVQTITATEEKKTRFSKLGTKQNRPDLQKSMSTKVQTYNDTILNNLYDPIERHSTTPSAPTQILVDRIVYKLDSDYNLLDEHDQYILDAKSRHIRLGQSHIALLRENGLI